MRDFVNDEKQLCVIMSLLNETAAAEIYTKAFVGSVKSV